VLFRSPATAKAAKPEPDKSSTSMSAKAASKATVTPIAKKAGTSAAAGPANKSFVPYAMKQGEDYMNDSQKEHFKRILLNWRSELMEEVDRTVHHMQDEAANPPDPADRATLEEEFSIELRTRDRERRLIKKIDSTIELIANDDYGYCDSCGVEIGIRRLEARPTANKCIDCKTQDEIKEKQLGSA
jgi:DnaK suppressor protein